MKRILQSCAVALLLAAPPGLAANDDETGDPDIASLTWLAGTRHIEREDGSIAYETWTGPAGGVVSGAVAANLGGGFIEYFRIMRNDDGVYGLFTANTREGLDKWKFRPLAELKEGRIVFADESGSFSIEATPDGGIHNIARRKVDGKMEKAGEWFWKPLP